MDKRSLSKNSILGGSNGSAGGTFKDPPLIVPFQGIGTRLRRSRSKDHSSDHDNLSNAHNDLEITNLKRFQLQQHHLHPQQQQRFNFNNNQIVNFPYSQQHQQYHSNNHNGFENFYSSSSGTLERTSKRYLNNNHHQKSSFLPPDNIENIGGGVDDVSDDLIVDNTQALYDLRHSIKNGSSSTALYEESSLLSQHHQYEEPQYLIDTNNRMASNNSSSNNNNNRKDFYTGTKFSLSTKRINNDLINNDYPSTHFNVFGRSNSSTSTTTTTSTVIPPSKLFAKTLSTYKQPIYELHQNELSGSKSSSTNQSSSASNRITMATATTDDDGAATTNGSSPVTGQSSSAMASSSTDHSIDNSNHQNQERGLIIGGHNGCPNTLSTPAAAPTSSMLHHRRYLDDGGKDHNQDGDIVDDDGDRDDDDDDDDDDEPTASLVGEELLSGVGNNNNQNNPKQNQLLVDNSNDHPRPMINGPSPQQHYSSIMHTYANPFQNIINSGTNSNNNNSNNSHHNRIGLGVGVVGSGVGVGIYPEDTTGPMIPGDLNTMRPSQLLKNSFAGSGPPPSLQSNSDRNLVRYLTERVWSFLRDGTTNNTAAGGGRHGGNDGPGIVGEQRKTPPEHTADHHQRCCPRWFRSISILSLIILVFILFIIIIFLTAMNRQQHGKVSYHHRSEQMGNHVGLENGRVPCVVVEDVDSSTSSQQQPHHHLSQQFGSDMQSSPENPQIPFSDSIFTTSGCPKYFPHDSSQYKEIQLMDDRYPPSSPSSSSLSSTIMPLSVRLAPFSSWSIWFSQIEPRFIYFQFYAPIETRLALVANRNYPPSMTDHQIYQVISEDALQQQDADEFWTNKRTKRDHSSSSSSSSNNQIIAQMKFKHLFEQGSWYLSLVNDNDQTIPLVVNISIINNHTIHCPNNCHNHGYCYFGRCQCFPGFIGYDCADNVCPVFCGGHGQYLQGSCRCEAGWKGRECTVRSDECEISDCNGNGICIEGICQCRSGFKGEYCDLADCIDPECSGHGVCLDGNCFCKAGFAGQNCTEPDTKLHKFFPNCSGHGVYDFENGICICHTHYSGPDCSQLSCSLDCGIHGQCREGRCICDDGWSGSNCQYKKCDQRCLEHGKCHNGTCHCQDGWMGRHCTLNGCPNSCSKHGRCVTRRNSKILEDQEEGQSDFGIDVGAGGHGPLVEWHCQCDDGWNGHDCSAPQETNCNDEIDNDNDGLVDCADSECCHHEQCGHQSLMCITSSDPMDILLRKQPLPPTSSFFQKVLFLIEDGSVQSYAQKEVYSPKRAAVIRGQVVSKELNGLIGIRVSVVNDLKFGFTLTRSDGWFDILVNGGGIITLQFQRNPFYPIKKSIYVAWNDITVIPNPIVMYLGSHTIGTSNGINSGTSADHHSHHQQQQQQHQEFQNFQINRASLIFYNLFSSSDFGESNWMKWMNRITTGLNNRKNDSSYSYSSSSNQNQKSRIGGGHCFEHNYEQMKPKIRHYSYESSKNIFITPNSEPICDIDSSNCIVAETQAVHERIRIGTTGLYVIYPSTQSQGYSSKLDIELTPSIVPKSLRFVLLRILIQGNVHEKIFEADPNIRYTFSWNKKDVYGQKVYGFSLAKIYVGYQYDQCPNLLWTAFTMKLYGFDMEISDIGQWNLEIHNRFDPHQGIFQRGDGRFLSFKDDSNLPMVIQPIAGIDGHPRSFTCTNPLECDTDISTARFFSLMSLASSPDGSLFVADSNLIRRITPDGFIHTVYKFKSNMNRQQNFEYHIAFNSIDQYLYISDPDRFQIVRIPIQEKYEHHHDHQVSNSMPEAEIVVGTGEQCFPHDRFLCEDGKHATEVLLIYPKDLAFGLDGTLFFADGSIIRMMDQTGHVRRIVGQFTKQKWKPLSCGSNHISNDIKLKWPTSLAINPIDGALYFVDNQILFKLNSDMQLSILYGYPSFCSEDSSSTIEEEEAEEYSYDYYDNEINCHSPRLDQNFMTFCGDELLFGSISFTPNGVLYLADISRRGENRIFALWPDGSLKHVAGYKTKKSSTATNSKQRQEQNKGEPCPVEKCMDMAGHNCTCLITEYSSEDSSAAAEQKISLKIRLQSISSMTTTGDGTVYVADEGRLRLYALKSYVPQLDDQQEIKILFPNSGQMYIFNKYGQHMRTRSITTGRTLYTFVYDQENDQGKLTELYDSSGNKILLIRDKTGSLHMIESAGGGNSLKCRTTINKQGLLESFSNGGNRSYNFDYYNNGLIRSRDDFLTGQTYFYRYDSNGRIKHFIKPNGVLISIHLKYDDKNHRQKHLISKEMPPFVHWSSYSSSSYYSSSSSSSSSTTTASSWSHHYHHDESLINLSNNGNNNNDHDDDDDDSPTRQTDFIINEDNSMIKFLAADGHSFELNSSPNNGDGFWWLNTSTFTTTDHTNTINSQMNLFYLSGKISKLSLDMLSIQAQMFPLISKFIVVTPIASSSMAATSMKIPINKMMMMSQQQEKQGRDQQNGASINGGLQSIEMEIDYNLRLKSSFIDSVEKFITINNTSILKIEYDWNANREIYYNQSQRPILFLQYDDYGRPIQWIPNIKQNWQANSITYDKYGRLDSWQNGQHQTLNNQKDRYGRIVELRRGSESKIRYEYDRFNFNDNNNNNNNNEINYHGTQFQLPSSITLKSGRKYGFDLNAHDGKIEGIITPKGSRHNLSISLVLGSYKFSYCPPRPAIDMAGYNFHVSPKSHCYLLYYEEKSKKPVMVILPYDTGKIIYENRNKFSNSKDFQKDFHRMKNDSPGNILVDKIIHGTGLVERWYDKRNYFRDLRGVWRNGNIEFGIQYKYTRTFPTLLKHQSYLFGNIYSVSQLTYNYRYDNLWRLRSIQTKLGSITLPSCDFVYDSNGKIESIGNFRYLERNFNETLVGDGIALLLRRYDPIRKQILHNSLTISDKEVFRADYLYDNIGNHHHHSLLVQTRTFMHHLGANKVRLQNFTYDADGQLIEMHGREHWRFVYDSNGNLITFLYMGNRVDLEYDHGDRIKNLGKSQHNSPTVNGLTPYITDFRGFVVQRGDEFLSYNNLGQLIQAQTPNRYEINYVYDYLGRLVLRRDHQKNVTQYFYGHPLKPHLVTHSFNNADGRVLSMIYDEIDDLLLMLRVNNENFYVVCDQTKSPVLIFDHRGQVIKEIHRSPYGHILFDSNPNFHIPVDFYGGILDPITNLIQFHDGRIYDTLTGRWLTLKYDQIFYKNFIKYPHSIHGYQFQRNDPINPRRKPSFSGGEEEEEEEDTTTVISLTQIQRLLHRQTSSLISQYINNNNNVDAIGGDVEWWKKTPLWPATTKTSSSSTTTQMFTPMMEKSRLNILKSSKISSICWLFENFIQKYFTFQPNYYSKLQQYDWSDVDDGHSLITISNTLFGVGVVLSRSTNSINNRINNKNDDDILEVHFSSHSSFNIDPLLRESLIILVNGSHLLDVHLVMAGQDHYFLVKNLTKEEILSATKADITTNSKRSNSNSNNDGSIDSNILAEMTTKFKQFQSILNLTVQEVYINSGTTTADKKMVIEVRIYQPSAVWNIRFGTNVPKERERVLRLAKKYAQNQRLKHERINIARGIWSTTNKWNDKEKQFIMDSKGDNWQVNGANAGSSNGNGINGILRMDYYHQPTSANTIGLAEDPSNINLRRSQH